jgi:hypothetical protein
MENRQVLVGITSGEELLFACFNDLSYLHILIDPDLNPYLDCALSWRDPRSNGLIHILALHDKAEAAQELIRAGCDTLE